MVVHELKKDKPHVPTISTENIYRKITNPTISQI